MEERHRRRHEAPRFSEIAPPPREQAASPKFLTRALCVESRPSQPNACSSPSNCRFGKQSLVTGIRGARRARLPTEKCSQLSFSRKSIPLRRKAARKDAASNGAHFFFLYRSRTFPQRLAAISDRRWHRQRSFPIDNGQEAELARPGGGLRPGIRSDTCALSRFPRHRLTISKSERGFHAGMIHVESSRNSSAEAGGAMTTRMIVGHNDSRRRAYARASDARGTPSQAQLIHQKISADQ